MKDYYKILDIPTSATKEEIKKAYRLQAIKYHPDKNPNDNYCTALFIEIKEAYGVLSNENKRKIYDSEYFIYHQISSDVTHKDNTQDKPHSNEDKKVSSNHFNNRQRKPFYNENERYNNVTPKEPPYYNIFGEKNPDNIDFFIYPKNIGRLILGYSTLSKEQSVQKEKIESKWSKLKKTIGFTKTLSGECGYVGMNGFAKYVCKSSRSNIIQSIEVNFKDIRDLFQFGEIKTVNFMYYNTYYAYIWKGQDNGETLYWDEGTYAGKENNPPRDKNSYYWFDIAIERYWTIYQLDHMEQRLNAYGHIEFNLFDMNSKRTIKYIQLGIGFIRFLFLDGNVTYNFDEIKKIYIKNNHLNIEHKNYNKNFLLFKSGNKNEIPLMYLANRQFFFKALELLAGVKFQ